MSQYADGVIADSEGLTVGADVDAVCQSADDEHVGTQLLQATDELTDEVLAVGGTAPRADDVDDATLVQVGIALIVEHDGCVRTFAQTGGIAFVVQRQGMDAVLGDELHLGGGALQGVVPVFHGFDEARCGFGDDVANVVALFVDGLTAAQRLIQQ